MLLRSLLLFLCLAAPAFGQDEQRYDNARFGYGLDIPAGFIAGGEGGNGDGQTFRRRGSTTTLAVWGGWLGVLTETFEQEVESRTSDAQSDGWGITYQVTTPKWASFSGTRSGQVLYQRMVLLCDGQSYAAFRAEYGMREIGDMDAVIETLVESLRGNC